jgi:hypothetical protein
MNSVRKRTRESNVECGVREYDTQLMTYSPRIVYTHTCVHFITEMENGTQPRNPLAIVVSRGQDQGEPFGHQLGHRLNNHSFCRLYTLKYRVSVS